MPILQQFLVWIACTQCVDAACCYRVQMSHVAWSVCWAHGWAVQKRLNRSRCRLEADSCHVGKRNHVFDGGYSSSPRIGHCSGDSASNGRKHSVLREVTRQRCGLLPKYFWHSFLTTLLLENYTYEYVILVSYNWPTRVLYRTASTDLSGPFLLSYSGFCFFLFFPYF